MKKKLLVVAAVGLFGYSYGQCDILGPDPVMCVTDAAVSLDSDAPGGEYTGPGVEGGVFTPAEAGIGTHTISYEAPGVGYTVEAGVYAPIDISSGGATTISLGDDAVSGAIPIGFTFNFFGTDYTDLYIGSNGFLTFNAGSPSGCCSGQLLPNASTPNNVIAFAWEDLDPGNGGAPVENVIRYETVGVAPNRVFIVEFFNVDHWSNGNNITSQTQIYETTNCIEIHTTTMPSDGGSHTMGIENSSGSEGYAAPGRNSANWSATNDMYSFCPNTGCTTSIEVQVVASPTVTATVDVEEICIGEEIVLTSGGSADEYSWGPGVEDGVAYTPTVTGENVFIVAGTDTDAGCVATAMVSVMVHAIPYVFAGDDMTVCEDEEFVLSAVGEGAFSWDNGATDGEAMTQDPGSVTYTVTATNEGGCEATSSVTVESLEAPTGTGVVTMTTGAAFDGSIDFTPSGGSGSDYEFSWTNGAETEDISALGVGEYTVTVSDGMCDSEVTFTVDTQLGIADNELENLAVYPNPVVDNFTIELDDTYTWILYNQAGQLVSQGKATGKEMISMEGLAAGSYHVTISTEEKSTSVALIKQ